MTDPRNGPTDWPEALATVLSCKYEMRAGRALAFGLPASRHFHITYNYWVKDQLHTADLYAEKPIPQGTLFPIRYDPDEPHRSQHADSPLPSNTKAPLITIGIIGSIILSTLWLLVLRSCH